MSSTSHQPPTSHKPPATSPAQDVADFLVHLAKERNVSPNTLAAYEHDCREFLVFLDGYYGDGGWSWQGIDRLAMRGFMGRLGR